MTRDSDFQETAQQIAEIAADFKSKDIRAYDVRELTLVTDCFLLCTAGSDRQLKAVYNGIRDRMREHNKKLITSEGEPGGNWMLLDYGSVIVHIFREEAREFYDLDGLWGDAEPVTLTLE